jgi:hypothetical protein
VDGQALLRAAVSAAHLGGYWSLISGADGWPDGRRETSFWKLRLACRDCDQWGSGAVWSFGRAHQLTLTYLSSAEALPATFTNSSWTWANKVAGDHFSQAGDSAFADVCDSSDSFLSFKPCLACHQPVDLDLTCLLYLPGAQPVSVIAQTVYLAGDQEAWRQLGTSD